MDNNIVMDKKYIFAIILDRDLQNELAQIREKYEPGVTQKIPAHISFGFSFFVEKDFGQFEKEARKIISSHKIFSAKLQNISSFERHDGNFVVHFSVFPTSNFESINRDLDQLINTFGKINSSFFGNNELPKYQPHVTLAINAAKSQEEEIRSKLANKSFNILCSQISLLQTTSDLWEIGDTFLLS